MIVLDGSGSMWGQIQGKANIQSNRKQSNRTSRGKPTQTLEAGRYLVRVDYEVETAPQEHNPVVSAGECRETAFESE